MWRTASSIHWNVSTQRNLGSDFLNCVSVKKSIPSYCKPSYLLLHNKNFTKSNVLPKVLIRRFCSDVKKEETRNNYGKTESKKEEEEESDEWVQKEPEKDVFDYIFKLITLTTTLLGTVGTIWCSYTIWKGKSSETWKPVEADVQSGQVFVWSVTRPGVHSLNYHYQVNGQWFEGSRYRVGHMWIMKEPIDIWKVDSELLQRGKKLTVYYNPENPHESTVIPGLDPGVWSRWLPLSLFVLFRYKIFSRFAKNPPFKQASKKVTQE